MCFLVDTRNGDGEKTTGLDKVVNILEQQEDKVVMGVSTVQGMASGWRRDDFCYKLQGWAMI